MAAARVAGREREIREAFAKRPRTLVEVQKATGIPLATISRWFTKFRREEEQEMISSINEVRGSGSPIIADVEALGYLFAGVRFGD